MSSNSKEQISSRRSQEITVTDPVDMASGVRTGNETSRGRSGGAGHHSAQQPVLGSFDIENENNLEEMSRIAETGQEIDGAIKIAGGQKMDEMDVTPGCNSLTIRNLRNHNTGMEKIFEADIIPGRRRLDRQAISHYIVQVAEHNVNSSEGRPEAALFSRLNEPQLHIKNIGRSSAQVADTNMNPISGFQVLNIDFLDPTIGNNTADTANEPNETKAEGMLRCRAEPASIIQVPTMTNTAIGGQNVNTAVNRVFAPRSVRPATSGQNINTAVNRIFAPRSVRPATSRDSMPDTEYKTVLAVVGRANAVRRDLRQKPYGEFVKLIAAEKVTSNQASGVMIRNSPITREIVPNEPTKEFNYGDEARSETEKGKGKREKFLVGVGKAYDGMITRVPAGEESDSEYSEGEAEKFDALERKYALANTNGT